ncbi:MAG TPA: DUF5011 domain-containing protein, partial [Candidatus Hydrogenedentes bacterium]|nr:DUF5011 domain-containing protein [Candidatus Hydrogenedentota bacterium]
EGMTEGSAEGGSEGAIEGEGEGAAEGEGEGEGQVVDSTPPEITLVGAAEMTLQCGESFTDPGATASDNVDGDLTGSIHVEGTVNVNVNGVYTLTYTVSDAAGNPATPVIRTVTVTGCVPDVHTADQNGDHLIGLSELLRVIQFFNSGGFHCQAGTEDGYAPAPGDQTCTPHAGDYNPRDWQIGLSELLRIIQFFNSTGYHACPGLATEDGYCPGPAKK